MLCIAVWQEFFKAYWVRLKARGVHIAQPHKRFYDWIRKAKRNGGKVCLCFACVCRLHACCMCMHVCQCMHVNVCMCMQVVCRLYVCACMLHVYTCMCMYACQCMHVYVGCMYACCVCACIHVYACMCSMDSKRGGGQATKVSKTLSRYIHIYTQHTTHTT
jgi:hypothetical protein